MIGMHNFKLGIILILLFCFSDTWSLNRVFGQPKLDSLFPACVEIGKKSTVKVLGTFANWPVKVIVDRPGLNITVGEKGILGVDVSAEAVPGIYWVRLLDPSGVSEPRAIILDRMNVVEEAEPNDRLNQTQSIKLPAAVTGVLAKSGDVDCYSVILKKGDTLVASMIANPVLGTSMDGVIQISDSRGFVLNQNDDSKGVDPQLVVKIPRDGNYLVRAFAFPAAPNSTVRFAGAADYRYVLRLTTGPFVDTSIPFPSHSIQENARLVGWNLEPGILAVSISQKLQTVNSESRPLPKTIAYSPQAAGWFETTNRFRTLPSEMVLNVTESITKPGEFDLFQFEATKGKKLRLEIESRQYGYELDPVITVFDANGKKLAEKDDRSKTEPDPVLDFAIPSSGSYFVRVKDVGDAGGKRFYYRLQINAVVPDFELSVAKSSLVVTEKQPVEFEVAVNRLDGFDKEISVTAFDLPSNILCESVISKPKGDSAKKVKLKFALKTKKAFQGRIEIRGVAKSNDGSIRLQRIATFALPKGKSRDLFLTAKE